MSSRILLFESSNATLWGEDIALEEGIDVEVIHAPPEAEASCGVALRVAAKDVARLGRALAQEGLEFEAWAGPA